MGDYSALTVSDGYAVVKIPLERVGAYIRLRGNTDCRTAFIVDPEGDECVIVDTGAGISCCGPDCRFFDDPSDPPASLRLMGANSSPLQVLKVGKFPALSFKGWEVPPRLWASLLPDHRHLVRCT